MKYLIVSTKETIEVDESGHVWAAIRNLVGGKFRPSEGDTYTTSFLQDAIEKKNIRVYSAELSDLPHYIPDHIKEVLEVNEIAKAEHELIVELKQATLEVTPEGVARIDQSHLSIQEVEDFEKKELDRLSEKYATTVNKRRRTTSTEDSNKSEIRQWTRSRSVAR